MQSLTTVSKIREKLDELIKNQNNSWKYIFSKKSRLLKQDCDYIDGSIYISSCDFLKKYKSFIVEGKTKLIKLNNEYNVDVDYAHDLVLAKFSTRLVLRFACYPLTSTDITAKKSSEEREKHSKTFSDFRQSCMHQLEFDRRRRSSVDVADTSVTPLSKEHTRKRSLRPPKSFKCNRLSQKPQEMVFKALCNSACLPPRFKSEWTRL